jgi:polyhydroxyalkanoate synthesis regulator phasin
MSLVLPGVEKKPSFSSQLGASIGQGLQKGTEKGTNFVMELMKNQHQQQLKGSEQIDPSIQNAIRSIEDMRGIVKKGNTGWNFFNKLTSTGRSDRAALDTSALNLEKLAADMVGKGTLSKQRFEYLKSRLPSSDKTDAENEAILDEWEKILGTMTGMSASSEKSQNKEKPPLSSFYR